MNKIMYFGSENDITKAVAVIKKHKKLRSMKEGKARLEIQKLIDKHNLKTSILLNGNTVWSKKRILQNLERIMKHGTLYDEDQKKPAILSHYFHQFLHQVCGSMNHGDIWGWIHVYPTAEDLKQFFKKNEFGKSVLEWIPAWDTDAREIVQQILKKLFPFEHYMETRRE